MKKIAFALLLLFFVSATASAEQVPVKVAAQIAARVTGGEVTQASLPGDVQGMYLFVGTQGFAIIAADDCVRPVLAYGERWCPQGDTLLASIHDWLRAYGEEIVDRCQRKTEASEATRQEWSRLMEAPQNNEPLFATVVSPMLTTTWNQSPRYNNLCPSGSVTGCVATATAQIMKYWNHPVQGTGSHSYVDGSNGMQSADFGATTYQWNQMPNALSGSSSTTQINAVATLMYHIGVAVEMSYGSSSSATTGSYGSPTSVCAENALKTYFGYAQSAHHLIKASMSDSLWCALIDNELAASRPILYSGRDVDGGHAFVLDGCNSVGQYHFNWGWGGYCDGYYIIGQLNPSPGGTGGSASSTYNLKNTAVMGIRPANTTTPATCPVNVTLTDPTHASVTGAGSHGYNDTVTVKVNTNPGYRFTRWSDGVHYNPRQMVVDSAVDLVAIVEPINSSDTVHYCNSAYSTSYGFGGTAYWGIKLLPADIEQFYRLSKVQVYDGDAGVYQLRIYKGGYSGPNSLIYFKNVNFTGVEDWIEITLDSALIIDVTMPLWVTFYNNNVSYPAAATTYGGHTNSCQWSSSGSSWQPLSNNKYSFMIKAIFQPAQVFEVVVNGEHGDVTGGGSYSEGSVVMIKASPDPCYAFSAWNDGNTSNPRYITITSDITLTALFEPVTIVEEVYDTATGSYTWNGSLYEQSGDYSFDTQTNEGCDSTAILHLVILPAQGIADVNAEGVRLYPNPVAHILSVEGAPFGSEVILYGIDGREYLRQTLRDEALQLDVAHLPSGTYLLDINGIPYRFVKR